MNLEVLLGSIFGALGVSATVALKSYKNAPEPIKSSHNYEVSNSGASDAISPVELELSVFEPSLEEVDS